MTRPSEIKPREDAQPGTPYDEIIVGSLLPSMEFTITPEINREYLEAIGEEAADYYKYQGRMVCPPNILNVYMMALLYRKYPPVQGIIVYDQLWRWYGPIYADVDTVVVADGLIRDKYIKRNKKWMKYTAKFKTREGATLAIADHTMYLPK